MKRFEPKPRPPSPWGYISFKVTNETHAQYKALAKQHGVSMIEFIRQSVEFAVATMAGDRKPCRAPRHDGARCGACSTCGVANR